MKKKILSLMLAMVMMLSLSVTALAANPTATGTSSITLGKVYEDTDAPEETFYLEWNGEVTVSENSNVSETELASLGLTELSGVEDVTADTGYTLVASTSENTDGDLVFTITLPSYSKVGIYTYELKEVDAGTSGVTYYSSTIYMFVTVIDTDGVLSRSVTFHTTNDVTDEESKIEEIENTYAAGALEVSKTVAGNLGDKSTDNTFSFTVTFTAPDGTTWDGAGVTVGDEEINLAPVTEGSEYTYTFELYHGQTITFENLPDGVTYSVVENDTTTTTETVDGEDVTTITTDNGYTVTYDGDEEGTISSEESASTTITNTKTGDVDTGINLDSLPYILMLIVVAAGVVVMISRKRLDNRF